MNYRYAAGLLVIPILLGIGYLCIWQFYASIDGAKPTEEEVIAINSDVYGSSVPRNQDRILHLELQSTYRNAIDVRELRLIAHAHRSYHSNASRFPLKNASWRKTGFKCRSQIGGTSGRDFQLKINAIGGPSGVNVLGGEAVALELLGHVNADPDIITLGTIEAGEAGLLAREKVRLWYPKNTVTPIRIKGNCNDPAVNLEIQHTSSVELDRVYFASTCLLP